MGQLRDRRVRTTMPGLRQSCSGSILITRLPLGESGGWPASCCMTAPVRAVSLAASAACKDTSSCWTYILHNSPVCRAHSVGGLVQLTDQYRTKACSVGHAGHAGLSANKKPSDQIALYISPASTSLMRQKRLHGPHLALGSAIRLDGFPWGLFRLHHDVAGGVSSQTGALQRLRRCWCLVSEAPCAQLVPLLLRLHSRVPMFMKRRQPLELPGSPQPSHENNILQEVGICRLQRKLCEAMQACWRLARDWMSFAIVACILPYSSA